MVSGARAKFKTVSVSKENYWMAYTIPGRKKKIIGISVGKQDKRMNSEVLLSSKDKVTSQDRSPSGPLDISTNVGLVVTLPLTYGANLGKSLSSFKLLINKYPLKSI